MRFTDLFRDIPHAAGSRGGDCRTCQLDGAVGLSVDHFPDLTPAETQKFGRLYRCKNCGGTWYEDEHKRQLTRIREERIADLRRWNENRLSVDESLLAVLAEIGGTINCYFETITIPCEIRTVSGQHFERGIVLVTKSPWFQRSKARLHLWADEVAAVVPSSFALPFDVRQASAGKREEAMGFSPVRVLDARENQYTLGCESCFFDSNGVKGPEIRLSNRPLKWWNRWPTIVWPTEVDAFFRVDWFEECDSRLCPSSSP